jgi:hypothetical protein
MCAKTVVWISGLAPKYIVNYLKLHSRTRLALSCEEETTTMPVSDATSETLQYLLEKYDMDPNDTKLLLSFSNKAACGGNSVMNNGHSNSADVVDVELAAPVLRRKGL